MKSKLVLVIVACYVATAAAQVPWAGESQRPRWQVYALEGLGALGGAAGVTGCLGLYVVTVEVEATTPVAAFLAAGALTAAVGCCGVATLPAAAG